MSETVRWMRGRIQNCKNINKTADAESRHATRIVLTVTEVATAIDSNQSETCQFFHNGPHREAVRGKRIRFLDVSGRRAMAFSRPVQSKNPTPPQSAISPLIACQIGGDHV
jgi:hypothetical protein